MQAAKSAELVADGLADGLLLTTSVFLFWPAELLACQKRKRRGADLSQTVVPTFGMAEKESGRDSRFPK